MMEVEGEAGMQKGGLYTSDLRSKNSHRDLCGKQR